MSASSRGHGRERQVRKLLESEGWWTCRAAGSLGDADIVAMKRFSLPRLIEVKSTAAGPYSHFGPVARNELAWGAKTAGAEAWLYWWAPRKELKRIPESEWP